MSDENPFGDLALRCPPIDVDEAAVIARDLFGREGTVRELGSNQDRNYRVDAPDGRFVLKIANPGWESVALEAQNAAMQPPGRAQPAVRRAEPGRLAGRQPDGAAGRARARRSRSGSSPTSRARRSTPRPTARPRRCGPSAASPPRPCQALTDFAHPGTDRTIQWDLRLARAVVDALDHWVQDDARRAQSRRLLEAAEALLAPLKSALPQQVVHADVTDYNVMATRDRAGRMVPHRPDRLRRPDAHVAHLGHRHRGAVARARRPDARARGRHRGDPRLPRGRAADRRRDRGDLAARARARERSARCARSSRRSSSPTTRTRRSSSAAAGSWPTRLEAVAPELAHEALRAALGVGAVPPRPGRGRPAGRDRRGRRTAGAEHSRRRARPVGARRRAALRRLGRAGRQPSRAGRGRRRHRPLGRGPPRPRPPRAVGRAGLRAPRRRRVRRRRHAGVGARGCHGRPRRRLGRDARLRRHRHPPGRHRTRRPARPAARGGRRASAPCRSPRRRSAARAPARAGVANLDLEAPGLATPAHAAGWLALCPDPSPLLGRDCAAPRDDAGHAGRAAATRWWRACRSTTSSSRREIERGWRHHLYDTDGPRLPRHGQQRRRARALAPARRGRPWRASCACSTRTRASTTS